MLVAIIQEDSPYSEKMYNVVPLIMYEVAKNPKNYTRNDIPHAILHYDMDCVFDCQRFFDIVSKNPDNEYYHAGGLYSNADYLSMVSMFEIERTIGEILERCDREGFKVSCSLIGGVYEC